MRTLPAPWQTVRAVVLAVVVPLVILYGATLAGWTS
jgi:hypothetical protein